MRRGNACVPRALSVQEAAVLYSCTPVPLYSYAPVLLYSCTPVLLYSCTPRCIGGKTIGAQGYSSRGA
jgi:hypothetical protein